MVEKAGRIDPTQHPRRWIVDDEGRVVVVCLRCRLRDKAPEAVVEEEDTIIKCPACGAEGMEPEVLERLVIEMSTVTGAVGCHGPLNDRGLCYRMLEVARDEVFKVHLRHVMRGEEE